MEYINKTDEQIATIAEDIYKGKIFTDRHIKENEDMVRSVFMPLVFMDEKACKEFSDAGIDMIYEYLDKAGPRGVNGYPIFMSFQFLNKADADKVWDKYEEIKKAVEIAKK